MCTHFAQILQKTLVCRLWLLDLNWAVSQGTQLIIDHQLDRLGDLILIRNARSLFLLPCNQCLVPFTHWPSCKIPLELLVLIHLIHFHSLKLLADLACLFWFCTPYSWHAGSELCIPPFLNLLKLSLLTLRNNILLTLKSVRVHILDLVNRLLVMLIQVAVKDGVVASRSMML